MKTNKFLIVIIGFILTNYQAQNYQKIYDAPDQVVWHAASRTWFISNLGGGISLEKDNNAWITRTDEKGKIINPFWIGKKEGMHALSGMTIAENYLYVVDRDGVYKIDIDSNEDISDFSLNLTDKRIQSLPTLKFIIEGNVKQIVEGFDEKLIKATFNEYSQYK